MSEIERVDAWLATGEPLDDTTARIIAGWHHGGQASALYSFVSTGNVTTKAIEEIAKTIWVQREQEPTDLPALFALNTYFLKHRDQGPQPDWNERTSY